MPNLYVTEQGSYLSKTGDRIIVQKDKEKLLDVRCAEIGSILIFGNVQISTQALHKLLEQGVEFALLTRTGKLVGLLTSPFTKNIDLRIAQFEKYRDENFRLTLARLIVGGKIANERRFLTGFAHNHPEADFKSIIGALDSAEISAAKAESMNSLLGIEGSAARAYFSGFADMILGDYVFGGRKMHPSPDPVNALLSLGYTMVFNEIVSLLDGLGFDPYLGYFHSPEYGRASLASDLLEEFRASVDRLTLFLINDRVLTRDDFFANPKDGAFYLTKEALKKYFGHYEERMNREFKESEGEGLTTLRKCYRRQAERLAAFIKGGAAYVPFAVED
jgi:CRISPR-associated protein Cas1